MIIRVQMEHMVIDVSQNACARMVPNARTQPANVIARRDGAEKFATSHVRTGATALTASNYASASMVNVVVMTAIVSVRQAIRVSERLRGWRKLCNLAMLQHERI